MIVGDRVRRRRDGTVGTVLEVLAEELVVDVEGEKRRWLKWNTAPVSVAKGPRGLARPTERMLAAARLAAEGTSRAELMALYGVSKSAIDSWIKTVREAQAEERNLRAVGR